MENKENSIHRKGQQICLSISTLKRQIVREIETNQWSWAQASLHYDIPTVIIYDWLKTYGTKMLTEKEDQIKIREKSAKRDKMTTAA